MSRKFLKIAGAVAALAASGSAHAAVVFSDNFNSQTLALNTTPSGWIIGNSGTVDVIGDPGFFDLRPGNGRYVDLGGSNGAFGLLATSASFAAGAYSLTFDLAGSARGFNNATTISLGDWTTTVSRNAADSFSTFTFNFTTTTAGALSFLDSGNNGNVGNLLDNVQLVSSEVNGAVPEPATWALMLIGFGVIGATMRRRSGVYTVRFAR